MPAPFADPPGRRPRVALVSAFSSGAFLERRLAGARAMAEALGMDLVEHHAQGDQSFLAARVLEEARGGADAIVVEHAEQRTVRPALEEALALGVKLVGLDTVVDLPGVPEVEQDDMLIGYLVARKLAVDCGGRGNVVVVTNDGIAPQAKRERAWLDHLWRYPGLDEAARINAHPARAMEDARLRVAEALERHPETTAVLALWDELARGAVQAVRDVGAAGRVAVYGVDVTDEDLQLMVEPGSPWVATAANDALASGRLAVRAAAALLAGERLEKYLLLQPVLITQAFLVGNRVRSMEHLMEALPALGESHLAWFPWMDRVLARNGQSAPAARLSPDQLPAQLRLTLAALEVRNEELQAAARTVHQARAELEQRVLERTAELSQANARLAASRAYLDRIIDAVAAPIFVKDRQHRFVLVNAALCAMLRRPREAILGRSDREFFPAEEAEAFVAGDERVFAGSDETVMEEALTDAAGAKHSIVTRKALYRNDAGAAFVVGVIDDVTERQRLEEALRQSQKMETVGLLAGGVAHDFNNLLTPILGYAELLAEGRPAGDPDRELLTAIHEAAARARDLTRRLLAFSRKQVLHPRPVNLVELIRHSEGMLRHTLREDIHLELALPAQLLPVRGDPGQLEQVLLNLAVNAQDAMPSGGLLRIEAADAGAGGRARPSRGDPRCVLTVSDTGAGMDERTQERAFEPFFTTKELGRGTGLGLSTVYGIVRQHGGSIAIRSRQGKGTSFVITLPATEGPAAPLPADPPLDKGARRSGTVLVAEDEDMVRTLTRRMLERFGFRVLEARSAEEALDLVRTYPGPIDVLLTDVVMPRMNGRQLHEAAVGLRPGLPALYMSGYAAEASSRQGVLPADVPFLQKPFSARDLFEALGEVLAASAPAPG